MYLEFHYGWVGPVRIIILEVAGRYAVAQGGGEGGKRGGTEEMIGGDVRVGRSTKRSTEK